MMNLDTCPTCGQSYERRTPEQNDKMWPTLRAIARQVDWYGQKLADWEWKEVFSAALKRQKVVPGLDGGFVVIGASTRRMTKQEMSELIDMALAFGAERGVKFPVDASHEPR